MTAPYKPGTTAVPGFPRITHNPRVMGGKACIRGMRVTVSMILGNLGAWVTIDGLLASYPYIEREDVMEALRFGASDSCADTPHQMALTKSVH